METNISVQFAKRALQIMKINFEDTSEIQYFVDKLNSPILFPATSTEGEIVLISREIASEIQKPSIDSDKLEVLLKDLDFKVSYLLFD